MSAMFTPPIGAVNHWENYGRSPGRDAFSCTNETEHCTRCGSRLIEHFEYGHERSIATGAPTYIRYHSCPTWFTGWRCRWGWTRFWFTPGMGHDSHDADNPLSARGYR